MVASLNDANRKRKTFQFPRQVCCMVEKSAGKNSGLIIHYRDEPDDREGQGKGSAPPGGEDHRNRE